MRWEFGLMFLANGLNIYLLFKKNRPRWAQIFSTLMILVNVSYFLYASGTIGWYLWKDYKRDQEMAEWGVRLKYWTEQTQCDHIFGMGTLNSNACRDRVAQEYGRSEEWEKEKKKSKEKMDATVEKLLKGEPVDFSDYKL